MKRYLISPGEHVGQYLLHRSIAEVARDPESVGLHQQRIFLDPESLIAYLKYSGSK